VRWSSSIVTIDRDREASFGVILVSQCHNFKSDCAEQPIRVSNFSMYRSIAELDVAFHDSQYTVWAFYSKLVSAVCDC
jgi:L-alanine-DL-glutamate epimerase-like enolase superfamily enzyme